jgi:hypothetical protein
VIEATANLEATASSRFCAWMAGSSRFVASESTIAEIGRVARRTRVSFQE